MLMEVRRMSPFQLLCWSSGIGAAAGFVALLKSKQELTPRSIVAVPAYAGAMGFVVAASLMDKDGTVGNAFLVLAMSVIQGLAGLTAFGLLLSVAKKSGISLQFSRSKDEEEPQ